MRIIIFLILIVTFSINLYSMNDTTKIVFKRDFSKAKLFMNNRNKLVVENISLYKDKIIYRILYNKTADTIPIEDISIIRVYQGNYALWGALTGAIPGLILPIYFINKNSSVPAEAFLYSALGFSALGFLIGSCIDIYKTAYHTGDFFITFQNETKQNNLYNSQKIIEINFCIR